MALLQHAIRLGGEKAHVQSPSIFPRELLVMTARTEARRSSSCLYTEKKRPGDMRRNISVLGGRLVMARGEAHMLRVDPLRMYAEIVLQGRENRFDLVGPERAADRQICQ